MQHTRKRVRVYPTPRGVYPTLHHMGGLVKQLDLQVDGVRIAAIVDPPRLNVNCSAWSNEIND